ncbi:lipid II:glycine glycyltransferase (peptidoglycan interpeptide bridge formation enzyme) [Kribbella amoyensis]|uniref:Lipid II:glycine glycyltransferase (Peptidoglycan interpeptide bridge formation enzyme) n=1 Tax=Kribbella amoyensis TaxID=996641 RepID=A0A561BX43_9ACTN|nr:peptidoglycan bridge formation glycyltransferase FemA/FemB family protein [Kribbella amoyensis]TWD83408.1 lipid II:glycine glycyltransferase (peptidoglycan interpeptide bridge formation enzyme) [Kribbella amoyensis]
MRANGWTGSAPEGFDSATVRGELTIGEIEPAEYQGAADLHGGRSFLQLASWAEVKPDWSSDLLAWRDADGRVVGTTLVLFRRLPGLSRWYAYVPEGPDIDWADPWLERWLDPLLDHLERRGAFAVRIGPPAALRRWQATTLKAAAGRRRHVDHVLADVVEPAGSAASDRLRSLGWQRCGAGRLAIDAQPRYQFQVPIGGRDHDLLAGFGKEWQRNIRKAMKVGVRTRRGSEHDLATFHELLRQTELRNGFRLGRSLAYYQRQYRALNRDAPDRMRLYLSSWNGEVLAAHTMNVVGRRAWYQTGGSASHRREVRPSHILQWTMMRDAQKLGAERYDMRGVSGCLDPEDPAFGLLRWKLGTGGELVETVGEWERPLPGPMNLALHRAMLRYRDRPNSLDG